MKIISIVGARPQFVKAAVVCRAIGAEGLESQIIHTGQHYDAAMSDVFFEQLSIPSPAHNLGVGSASHAEQTGEMMKRLETVLIRERPDWIVLYGDTNSTLAGALVAAKLCLPVAHVEAGLRSFNRRMPEEINRIVADRLSDLLLCPTSQALENLRTEGLAGQAVLTGDVMYDAFLFFRHKAEAGEGPAAQWAAGSFALATVHRAENTDDPERLGPILESLEEIAANLCPVLLPLHPRTRRILGSGGWEPRRVTVIEPVSYLDMLVLESRARLILTDSGGVQKEAYFAKVPCVTLRDETEWVETLENGCNVLAGANRERILEAVRRSSSAGPWTAAYGGGDAGARTVRALRRV